MDSTSLTSELEVDSGVESTNSTDGVVYIRVSVPELNVQVWTNYGGTQAVCRKLNLLPYIYGSEFCAPMLKARKWAYKYINLSKFCQLGLTVAYNLNCWRFASAVGIYPK